MMERLTIGEVSRRSGISVRMLRHYDEIGLVTPERRPENGYRLYSAANVARIQAIVALRQLGFSLGAASELLGGSTTPLAAALKLRLNALDEEITRRNHLRVTLLGLLGRLERANDPSLDELFDGLRELTQMERINRHYTEEQLAELAERAGALGAAGMQRAQDEWTALGDEVRSLIEDRVAPDDPRARSAAERWDGLISAFTGGNADISAGLTQVWETDTEIPGVDVRAWRELGEYIESVRKARP